MNTSTTTAALNNLDADLLALIVSPEAMPDLTGAFGDVATRAAEDAAAGEEPVLFYPTAGAARRVALFPLKGEDDEGECLRNAAGRAAALARRLKATTVALARPDAADAGAATALVEGFILGGYRFTDYRHAEEPEAEVEQLLVRTEAGDAVRAGQIRAEATCFARDLVNLSPHEKTPALLAERAEAMAREVGLRCEVWGRAEIEGQRMGGLLAVNRGSVEPPRFVILEHRPEGAVNARPVVLVGKAVVFDTGGLSLKPTAGSMDKMKADMAGGAAVLGTMEAVARLALPLHVVALIPMTDNRPGEHAYVPGDVVDMRSGTTVEVLNTDAEGRMILADALDYAKDLEPELVVDVATLTGAQVVALGTRVAAVMTPEDDGAEARLDAFRAAARRTGDWVWPLPLHAHYAEALKSDVADLKNIGNRGEAGSIAAGKFLEHFIRTDGRAAYPWVHVDIAGPAFLDSPQPYRPKGGTGFGVRLFTDLLQQRALADGA